MAIDQNGLAETPHDRIQLAFQEPMIGAVNFIDPTLKLRAIDPSTPEGAVPMGPRWNEAKAISGTWPHGCRRNSLDNGGIHFLLSTIAIDNRPRDVLDDGPEAGGDRPPAETVHERVLKGFKRPLPLRRIGENGRVIFATRMGHRQKDRQRSAGGMQGRRRVGAHMQQQGA